MADIWHRLELDSAAGARRGARSTARAAAAPSSDYAFEIRPLSACRSLIEEWRALAERTIEPNIFAEPEMLLPAAQHLPAAHPPAALLVRGLRGASAGRLLALVPLARGHLPLLPDHLKIYTSPYHLVGVPLVDRAEARPVLAALLGWAQAQGHAVPGLGAGALGMTGLLFPRIPLDGPFAQALTAAAGQSGRSITLLGRSDRPVLRASGEVTPPPSAKARHKAGKELARCQRRLGEHGPVIFEEATTGAALRSAIEAFLVLEASSWKGERGTAMVQDARRSSFFRAATRLLGQAGKCSVLTLCAGGQPVAAALLLHSRSRSWFYRIAYDAAFAKVSPGVMLTIELSRRQIADGRRHETDSCADYPSALLGPLWPQTEPYADMLVSSFPGVSHGASLMLARETLRRSLRQSAKTVWRRMKGYRR